MKATRPNEFDRAELQAVRRLFRNCWPNRQAPGEAACYPVKAAIDIVRHQQDVKGKKRPDDLLGDAAKYGRLFLRHLAEPHQELERTLSDRKAMAKLDEQARKQLGIDWYESTLAEMDEAARRVEAVLIACKAQATTSPNPARFIAEKCRDVWRRVAPESKVPRSVNPDDPLCRFVRDALALADIRYSANTVSGMLRDRADRIRTGKKRAS